LETLGIEWPSAWKESLVVTLGLCGFASELEALDPELEVEVKNARLGWPCLTGVSRSW